MQSLSKVQKFKSKLRQYYPQLTNVVQSLVLDYNNALLSTKQGHKFETKAMFGRIIYNHDGEGVLNPHIPVLAIGRLLTTMSSFSGWDSVSEWYLSYDYKALDGVQILVSYENDKQQIQCRRHHSPAMRDIGYEDKHPSLWHLRNYTTRVIIQSYEDCVYPECHPVEFERVSASMRKNFVVQSSCLQMLSWRMEIIQTWTAATIADVEESMLVDDPVCAFTCEILNLPQADILTDIQKSLVFASLLLKMQDFLDIPNHEVGIEQSPSLTNTPVFHFI